MDTRIYETDLYGDIAEKIFKYFEVGQSCCVKGIMQDSKGDIMAKGEAVVLRLTELDANANTTLYKSSGKLRRKRVKPENSIGDYVAQKMWRWSKETRDGKPVYTIWRMQ